MPTNRAKICREMDVEAVRKRDLRAGRVCKEAEPRGGHHHELHPARNTGRPLRCNRTRMLRDYEHLPYSHDAVKYAACSNHYDAVQWAFERQQKQWSQEMIGNNFSRLVYCPGPSETSAFIAMLSGLCNEADVKQALIIALSNACSSHAKAVISGRHGKTPDVSEVFRTHASDLVERKVLRSEDGLLRLGEDESSTMLLTLGEICHGCDVYLAFKASVEHSLVDCIEALIHRVPVEYAVNALRDLLRNGRLNREDLRAVLVQHSAGDKEQELQVFRVLLLEGCTTMPREWRERWQIAKLGEP